MKKRLCLITFATILGILILHAENVRIRENSSYNVMEETKEVCPMFETLVIDNKRKIAGDNVYLCFIGDRKWQ